MKHLVPGATLLPFVGKQTVFTLLLSVAGRSSCSSAMSFLRCCIENDSWEKSCFRLKVCCTAVEPVLTWAPKVVNEKNLILMVNCDNQDANKWILDKPSIGQFHTVMQLVDSENEEDWENAILFDWIKCNICCYSCGTVQQALVAIFVSSRNVPLPLLKKSVAWRDKTRLRGRLAQHGSNTTFQPLFH